MLRIGAALAQGYIDGLIQVHGYLQYAPFHRSKVPPIVGYIKVGEDAVHMHATLLAIGIGAKYAHNRHLFTKSKLKYTINNFKLVLIFTRLISLPRNSE